MGRAGRGVDKLKRLRLLVKLAMLSENSHEVLVAIGMVRKILAKMDRDVDWLLDNLAEPSTPMEIVLDDWRLHLAYINEPASQGRLNDWELRFAEDVAAKATKSERWRPSIRQEARMRSIYMRLKITEGVTANG